MKQMISWFCTYQKSLPLGEVSQDWHTHISYAEDGTINEIVILEASKQGAWPLLKSQAA
ncbi:hypothetical protein HAALTHF_29210n [Vreelandella aquamarina]|nr:hypothetical protein HAALTHF_29210n [Halomonas axialensis]